MILSFLNFIKITARTRPNLLVGWMVPNGPSSEQLARLFEAIFKRYPKASAIGFATIPSTDEGGLSIAALNRMIEGAIKGLKARETRR